MDYRIGVVSELLGISPEGLRLYERTGILDIGRDPDGSTYRAYKHLDITALIRARSYHNYGFSLKETQALINAESLDFISEEYRAREQALEEEIARKQLILEYLRDTAALTEGLPQTLFSIAAARRPAMYRFEFMDGDDLILMREEYGEFQKWVDLAPLTFAAQRNFWEALMAGEDHSISALGIFEPHAKHCQICESRRVTYHPACECLYTIVEIVSDDAAAPQYLRPLTDYVQQNHIQVTGDPIARTFLAMNRKKRYTRYREIWLPVE